MIRECRKCSKWAGPIAVHGRQGPGWCKEPNPPDHLLERVVRAQAFRSQEMVPIGICVPATFACEKFEVRK